MSEYREVFVYSINTQTDPTLIAQAEYDKSLGNYTSSVCLKLPHSEIIRLKKYLFPDCRQLEGQVNGADADHRGQCKYDRQHQQHDTEGARYGPGKVQQREDGCHDKTDNAISSTNVLFEFHFDFSFQ